LGERKGKKGHPIEKGITYLHHKRAEKKAGKKSGKGKRLKIKDTSTDAH